MAKTYHGDGDRLEAANAELAALRARLAEVREMVEDEADIEDRPNGGTRPNLAMLVLNIIDGKGRSHDRT